MKPLKPKKMAICVTYSHMAAKQIRENQHEDKH